MKVIKKPNIPLQVCYFCGALLLVKPKDFWHFPYDEIPYYTCKCCGEKNKVCFKK